MKDYKYSIKKITLHGRQHDAVMVKGHSTLDGLIFEWIDTSDRGWDQFPNWVRQMYILPKGTKKWIYKGKDEYTWAKCGLGWISVLHGLENDKVKNRIEINEEKKELKRIIKDAQERLKELEA